MRALVNPVLILLILLSVLLGSSLLTRGHQWGDDWAGYVLQAKSLLNGTTEEFMRASEFTNTQSTMHVGPLAYPWGYPLILAPMYALRGMHPLTLKLPGLFLFAGFLICFFLWTKPHLRRTESLLLVSFLAFNPILLQFLDQILSDIPFLFFSTLTLLLMTQKGKRNTLQSILIGASVFMTTFLRATGVFLLGAFLMVEFFKLLANRNDRRQVMEIIVNSFVSCFAFAVLWGASLMLLPSGGESYLSQYSTLTLDIVRMNINLYFMIFRDFFGNGTVWRYIYYALFLFFLVGAWVRRKHEPVFIAFFVIWMLVHITYPYWQGPRYMFPLVPIFIYFTFHGMKAVLAKIPAQHQWMGNAALYSFWLLTAGIFLYNSGRSGYLNLQSGRAINGPFDPYSREVYQFIQEETPPDSVVIFFKPRVMVLMTGHNTIMSTECERMLLGDYLVLSRKVGENQQIPPEQIDACNLPLVTELKNNRFVVYEIQK